jgi:hypothetical protein
MIDREHENILLVKEVCKELGSLVDSMVLVGASCVLIYLKNTEIIKDVRVTEDVDFALPANRKEYYQIDKTLRLLGFKNVPDVICRYKKSNLIIDVMPIDERVLGFTNQWYKKGFDHRKKVNLGEQSLYVLPVEYFLASKIEAFEGRGSNDFLASKDMEDIITLLAGEPALLDWLVMDDTEEVAKFIKEKNKRLSFPR